MERIIKYELTEQELRIIVRTAVVDGIEEYERRKKAEDLLTTIQVAKLKKCTPQTIRNAIASGELKAELITKRKYGITRQAMEAYKPR